MVLWTHVVVFLAQMPLALPVEYPLTSLSRVDSKVSYPMKAFLTDPQSLSQGWMNSFFFFMPPQSEHTSALMAEVSEFWSEAWLDYPLPVVFFFSPHL